MRFMDDLRSRLANRIQLTTTAQSYGVAVHEVFGADVDYAVLQKLYGPTPGSNERAIVLR